MNSEKKRVRTAVLHFKSGGYTTIKTRAGQYSFFGIGKYEMLEHHKRLSTEAAHIARQLAALTVFLDGESVSDPAALHA